ncbi:hypothetical protein MNBD_GAMMA11-96, partial [hydrothermal vent metagenome]
SSNLNTEMGLLVNNAELANQVLELFRSNMVKQNSYHLKLVNAGSVKHRRIEWHTEEAGEDVLYLRDPQAGFWRKLSVFIYRLLPVEEFL